MTPQSLDISINALLLNPPLTTVSKFQFYLSSKIQLIPELDNLREIVKKNAGYTDWHR